MVTPARLNTTSGVLLLAVALSCAPAGPDGSAGSDAPTKVVPEPAPQQAVGPPQADPWNTGEWQTTASGLQYRVLEPGEGAPPGPADQVTLHYTKQVAGGAVVATATPDAPASVVVGGLPTAGWNEAVALMRPGAHHLIKIPPHIGYGEMGMDPVPPDATLHVDCRMLSVRRIPEFRRLRPDRQRHAHLGLVFDVLREGSGTAPGDDETVRYHCTVWNHAGDLVESTLYGAATEARLADLPLPVHREALRLMRPGSTVLFRAPDEITYPRDPRSRPSTMPVGRPSYWRLRLLGIVRPQAVPAFAGADPSAMQKTDTGLRYEVLQEGGGAPPSPSDRVAVHYAGWLADGSLFDSSYPRGAPAEFDVDGVIAGWREALLRMAPGAVYRLWIPPELAYAETGVPGMVPPDAVLLFHVHLVRVLRQ